jgi:tetratricopeptide (TPR) repeat protein
MLCQDSQQLEPAIAYWRRAIDMNPWMPQYRQNLALLLEHKRAWEEVRPECQAWLRLDPASVDARRLWAACLLKEGKKAEARAEFARIEQLNPPNLRELNAWFTEQMRRLEQ